jgi:acyl-CoA thioesterase-1
MMLDGCMKKTVSCFCITGVIVFLCLNGCGRGTAGDIGVSVVCLGDSLTAGYGATIPGVDDKTKSYPAYLQKKINIPVVNAGVTGDTTSQALARIDADVLIEKPRIVIIELGANDLFKLVPWTTKANLQRIIDLVNSGNRKIYIAKFYTEAVARTMADELNIDYSKLAILIAQYDEMFEDLAASNNIELIDHIWDGVWGIHMSDQIHPNAKGYELMADNYYKAMEPYLRENNLIDLSGNFSFRTGLLANPPRRALRLHAR